MMKNPITESTKRVEKYVASVLEKYKAGTITQSEAKEKLSIEASHEALKGYPTVGRLSKQGYQKSAVQPLMNGLEQLLD